MNLIRFTSVGYNFIVILIKIKLKADLNTTYIIIRLLDFIKSLIDNPTLQIIRHIIYTHYILLSLWIFKNELRSWDLFIFILQVLSIPKLKKNFTILENTRKISEIPKMTVLILCFFWEKYFVYFFFIYRFRTNCFFPNMGKLTSWPFCSSTCLDACWFCSSWKVFFCYKFYSYQVAQSLFSWVYLYQPETYLKKPNSNFFERRTFKARKQLARKKLFEASYNIKSWARRLEEYKISW